MAEPRQISVGSDYDNLSACLFYIEEMGPKDTYTILCTPLVSVGNSADAYIWMYVDTVYGHIRSPPTKESCLGVENEP